MRGQRRADHACPRLRIGDDDFGRVVAIEFGRGLAQRHVAEHNHAAAPAQFIVQFLLGFARNVERMRARNRHIARQQHDGMLLDAGTCRLQLGLSFDERDPQPAGLIAHQEFRAQIRHAMLGRKHHEGPRRIVFHLEISFTPHQRHFAARGAEIGSDDSVGVQFDPRTIGERDDFAAADRGGISLAVGARCEEHAARAEGCDHGQDRGGAKQH